MSIKGIEPVKLKKVIEAEKLSKVDLSVKTDDEKTLNTERLNKSIKIYKELCLNPSLPPTDKIEVLTSFLKHIPEEGKEMLIRLRDLIVFCKGREQDDLVQLLTLVCKNPSIDSHERCMTAVTLYNQAFLNVCYLCFESIAVDKAVLVAYRIEGCLYLFASELNDNIELAQECLIEIIEDQTLPSDYRYKTIAKFISKTGISTYLNSTKLRIPYNEEFVYGLQTNFFYNTSNGIRERILSGQHLLAMTCVTDDEKTQISEILIQVSEDENYDENTRADAADVILRLGTPDFVRKAREIITNLGFSGLGKSDNLLGKIKTIYTNSQNIHDETISESISKFIEKIIHNNQQVPPYHEIQQEVADMIRSKNLPKSKKHLIFKALNRVSIDTATFTKYNITISQVFSHVWVQMKQYPEHKELLDERLIEELHEMGDTCSSGHAGRFVNVLSVVDSDLRIGFDTQIEANLAGRINARIRDIEDSDLRVSVSGAMMPDADEEDKEAYKTFIVPVLAELYKEMHKEFVGDKYITDKEFKTYFAKARKQWEEFM